MTLGTVKYVVVGAGELGTTIFHPIGTCTTGNTNAPAYVIAEKGAQLVLQSAT